MVFDDWRNGIPVAFFAISRMREQDLVPVLQALHKRVSKVKKDWSPSSIIVDNAQAEINTLGYVLLSTSITLISCIWFSVLTLSFVCRVVWPGAKIFLCLWYVRKTNIGLKMQFGRLHVLSNVSMSFNLLVILCMALDALSTMTQLIGLRRSWT